MKENIKLDHFIVIGGMAWGRADTIQQAFWNWWKEADPGSGRFYSRDEYKVLVRQVDKDAYVDDMGTLHYRAKHEMPDIVLTKATVKAYVAARDAIEGLVEESGLEADFDAEFEGVEVEKVDGATA